MHLTTTNNNSKEQQMLMLAANHQVRKTPQRQVTVT